MSGQSNPCIGIALGGGAARGWAHIGVLQQLAEMHISPEIVCGCSSGAIVGAAYAADNLAQLEKWAVSLKKLDMIRYFELKTTLNGFIHQQKFRSFFHQHVCAEQQSVTGLTKPFATVAADLHSGQEIWLRDGKVIDAVWPSIALPGLFPPVAHEGRWLVDGGLVNPVPVSLCRALGADVVIAVNLIGIARDKNRKPPVQEIVTDSAASIHPESGPAPAETEMAVEPAAQSQSGGLLSNVAGVLREYSSTLFTDQKATESPPGIIETVTGSISIMQDRITRGRMVGDPPDVLLNPRLDDLSLMEFYRAAEAIEEGRACVRRLKDEIEYVTRIA